MNKLARLYKIIKYQFSNEELVKTALTHGSYGIRNYERLEFLGDSILNFIIALELYTKFSSASEGDLTRLRAIIVRKETLAEVAKDIGLGEYIVLGIGEKQSGGHQRSSILADTLEALIAACYLDSDIQAVRQLILHLFQAKIDKLDLDTSSIKDAKTRLQELLQAVRQDLPQYELIKTTGKDHNQSFIVCCQVKYNSENFITEGMGSSIKFAEQEAASKLLTILNQHGEKEK